MPIHPKPNAETSNPFLRDVKLGRDFGEEVEVLRGLQTGQRVIVYAGDDLPEGSIVQPDVATGTK